MRPDRHVLALGGGGFSFEGDSSALDDYVLGLTGAPKPKVCFLPTASGDDDSYIVRFYAAFPASHCEPSHLALFRRIDRDLRSFLLGMDIVYVGGGNTANMLAIWRLHGLDAVLRQAWEAGVVMCGVSAGSICWFEGGTTDSFGADLVPLRDGLGFLPGSHCPHYDGSVKRRPAYHRFVEGGLLPPGFAADNGVGLHFTGTELTEVVSCRPGKRAFRVECTDGEVRETPLEAKLLTETTESTDRLVMRGSTQKRRG